MTSDQVRFSFVIPFYNCNAWLRRAVGSVLAQSGSDWELILVDDGSTEPSEEALAGLHDEPRIRLLQQSNAGPGAARNHGAREARGEFVWFLDCDDELLPDAAERVRGFLGQSPDTEMLVGGHLNRTPDGSERLRPARPLADDNAANFVAFIRKQLGSFSHGAVVVRRTLFERLGYPEGVRNNEDLVLHALILASHRCRSIPEPLVRIHSRPDSLRHDIDAIRTSGTAMVDLLFDPALLPAGLMGYREEFSIGRRLSRFRSLCNAGERAEARAAYLRIIRDHPAALMRWAYLKKFLRLLF